MTLSRSKLMLHCLAIFVLLATLLGSTVFVNPALAVEEVGLPVQQLLNTDGTLNLSTGYTGNLAIGNYGISLDPARGPVFRPLMASNAWNALGTTPLNSLVSVIAISGSNVYVGGTFTNAGGNLNADFIAKWDTIGQSWSALGSNGAGEGSLNSSVTAIAIDEPDIYVGGQFSNVNNNGTVLPAADFIAKWDGSDWSALGSGSAGNGSLNSSVTAIAINQPDIYVGGQFSNVDNNGTPLPAADFIAKWDGANWSALGATPLDGNVTAIAVSDSDLYVGGAFTEADGDTDAAYIAKWDGANWSALGTTPLNDSVSALAVSDSDLYVGGNFTEAGGDTDAAYIAKWDGANWSALGSTPLDGPVSAIAVSGPDLYVGGFFITAGGDNNADFIARWNGTTWLALGPTPLSSFVSAVAVSGVNVYAGGFFNNAGGNANADKIARFERDVTPPMVVSSVRANTSPTNAASVDFTVTFSEVVAGVGTDDFSLDSSGVSGASVTGVSGSGSTRTVAVNTGSGDGTIRLDVVDDDSILDVAFNPLDSAFNTGESYTVDKTVPGVSMSSAADDPTNAAAIAVTVTFTENVTGFSGGDITTGNGTVSNFTGTGASYSFDLTPTADGLVTADIAASVAQDAAGNNNTAATQFSRTYDGTAPGVSMSSGADDPTNAALIEVTVTFTESVTGFSAGDITTGNATLSNFAGTGASYSFDLTPTADGVVTADIAGGVAQDAVGNNNTAATQFSRTYDTLAPGVSMSSSASDPTNAIIPITITFTESVTGFSAGDITTGNGTVSNFTGTGASYSFDLTPTTDGTVTADIAASVAQDAAGNDNTAATQFSRTYDGTAPGVSMSSGADDPTNTVIPITVTFTESVTDFTAGDITTGNGTVSNFTGSGASYSFDLTPTADGTVTADIAGGVAQDAAGNGNTAATQFSLTYDGTAPGVSMSSSASNPTNAAVIAVTVTFTESVTDFTAGDIVPGNASVSNFAGTGASYSFDLIPTADGVVTADIAASVAQDAAGNNNTAAAQFSRTYDGTAPGVSMSSSASNPTNAAVIAVTVTFTESVTDFTAGDIVPGNASVSNFAGTAASYSFDLTPTTDGVVTADIAASVAQDAAGNNNTAAAQFSRTYDGTAPGVSMSSGADDPTNTFIPVTVTFTESVTGFSAGDITTGNGTVSNFTGSGTSYSFDLTPTTDGLVTADIAGGVAQDAAGNDNTAATQFSLTYDGTAPGVSMSSSASDPTNAAVIAVTVTFTESVTGFSAGDITTGNGTVSNFAGTGASYSFDLTPTADGLVTADIAASVAQDAASNNNTAAAQFSRTYDTLAPGVSMTSSASNPTNAAVIAVTVTFTESVTGFSAGDITTGNATVNNFTGSGASYSFDLTPTTDGVVTADIATSVAQDTAGNNNTAAAQFSRTYDTVAPGVSMSSTAGDPTNTVIPVTVTFTESVTSFTSSDVTMGNATLSNFTGSGTSYSFDLTPTANGTVTANIAASVAQDLAGNDNTAATQFNRTYDGTAPGVSMSSSASNPTNSSSMAVTVTFTESVTGFTAGDITAGNGTLSNFAGSGASYSFDLTPTADGLVTANIAGGVAQDAAGNGNTAATQFSRAYDGTAPTVVSSVRAEASPTNAANVDFTVTFSESVTGVDTADLTLTTTGVSGASITGVVGSGSAYTVSVNTGSGDGTIRLDVLDDGSIQDAIGNSLGGGFTNGEVYTVSKTLTFRSTNTRDGWVLESSETSNRGGTLNNTASTFRLGDDVTKKQYRSILSFSTASIPDNAVITAVTLKVKRQGVSGGGNPVTAFQGFMVDIRKGLFGTSALQTTDFQATANKVYGPFMPALVSGWYSINLTSGKAYVNNLTTGGGLTQIRLRFKLDDNNNAIANTLNLFSGNAGLTSRPQLVITYYVP